jgi:SAM-dependent methyltransferase
MDDDRAPKAIVASGYDRLGPAFERWADRVEDPARDRLFATFASMLPVGAAVLDIGCGSGIPWTRRLAERFAVTAIDISPIQAAAARRNLPGCRVLTGDVATLELDHDAFDGMTALYSLGHLPAVEQARTLWRMAGWLRPGGLLLASLPAVSSPGWTGEWLGTQMFFASLGTAAYGEILGAQGWQTIAFDEVDVQEPGAAARFVWVLAVSPARNA